MLFKLNVWQYLFMKKKLVILLIVGVGMLAVAILGYMQLSKSDLSSDITDSLPIGYTLDTYVVEKVTEDSCTDNLACETPMEYLVQSRCPFTSLCLENKCTVVCPDASGTARGPFMGEHPCNLEPDAGSCEAAMSRYFFDKEEGKCKEFLWGGCDGTVPFDLLEVCRSTCEREE